MKPVIFALGISILLTAFVSVVVAQTIPATIVLDGNVLDKQRQEGSAAKNKELTDLISSLSKKADRKIKEGKTYSVTSKSQTPPSGDMHDYMSQAPYWWPDPTRPNGLPYIRKDGERNPELLKITDPSELGKMLDDAELLALVYYFTKREMYAKHSAAILRAWFLDSKTKQNPNLNFAQNVPGISKGRGFGLIETRHLYRAIDASILLEGSGAWKAKDKTELRSWFSQFLTWMVESPVGKDEADERNNHGTHYDVQVIAYSIYTGRQDLAMKQLNVTKSRIATQIEPDGSQPHELARTLSWGYVNMNLHGFFTIARLAESVNVDLWRYRTNDGRGIKSAFEWLIPFAANDKEWTHKQIKPRTFELTEIILRIASKKFRNEEYALAAKRISPDGGKLEQKDLGNY